jgi:hypothetical protein
LDATVGPEGRPKEIGGPEGRPKEIGGPEGRPKEIGGPEGRPKEIARGQIRLTRRTGRGFCAT